MQWFRLHEMSMANTVSNEAAHAMRTTDANLVFEMLDARTGTGILLGIMIRPFVAAR